MTYKNLSPQEMFFKMAVKNKPKYRFGNNTKFKEWKERALPHVLNTLGKFPDIVPLNPVLMAEWNSDGVKTQRWSIDVGDDISAIFMINIPEILKSNEKAPSILCWHGHGKYGKFSVMGSDSFDVRNEIQEFNCDYGWKLAKKGFVTFAIDWIGGGERSDDNKPNYKSNSFGRDWCNLYYLHATMLGMTPLSINLIHGKLATNFACTLPNVDENKLGVMGLSGGGVMTLWSTLFDERFKATQIIGYSDLWAYFGFRDLNYCGMQVAPGLFTLVDVPELQGLIAPRPLLIDIGANDNCFVVDTSYTCFKKLQFIYKKAKAEHNLHFEFHSGGHEWGGEKSDSFFRDYLV